MKKILITVIIISFFLLFITSCPEDEVILNNPVDPYSTEFVGYIHSIKQNNYTINCPLIEWSEPEKPEKVVGYRMQINEQEDFWGQFIIDQDILISVPQYQVTENEAFTYNHRYYGRIKSIVYNSQGEKKYTPYGDTWDITADNAEWCSSLDENDSISGCIGIDIQDAVYAGTDTGYLYCINPDGSRRFKYNLTEDSFIAPPYVTQAGKFYFISYLGNLITIDNNGKAKNIISVTGRFNSSPVVDNENTIFFTSYNKCLYAVEENGTIKWQFNTDDIITGSPAIDSGGTVYVCSYDKKVYAIQAETGQEKWRFGTDGSIHGSAGIGNVGTIYVASLDCNLYAINSLTGQMIWKYEADSKIFTTPHVDQNNTIYFSSHDGTIYAIDGNTGDNKWEPIHLDFQCMDCFTLCDNGILFVGLNNGIIYAINKENRDIKWKYQTNRIKPVIPIYSNNGSIYIVNNNNNLAAIR